MLSDRDIKELWEERSAIREYLGGYSREEAELLAYEDVKEIKGEKNNNDNVLLPSNKFQKSTKTI